MQQESLDKIKVILVYYNKIVDFEVNYFVFNVNNFEYSIFLNHENLILPLIKSNVSFFINESDNKILSNLDGLFCFDNNTATFFVEEK